MAHIQAVQNVEKCIFDSLGTVNNSERSLLKLSFSFPVNLTFVFLVLKFGIPLMTHLNLRVVLVSKIS